jgi:hypothetical protein
MGIPLHRFPWTEAAGKAGLTRDAAYLVRPDGHVGLVTERQDAQAFTSYVEKHGIRPRRINGGSGKQTLSSAA